MHKTINRVFFQYKNKFTVDQCMHDVFIRHFVALQNHQVGLTFIKNRVVLHLKFTKMLMPAGAAFNWSKKLAGVRIVVVYNRTLQWHQLSGEPYCEGVRC